MTVPSGLRQAHLWFRVFKYSVYCLLALNILLFFQSDLSASAQTFTDGVSWHNFVEAYSATIDTFAWVILLLLFELETAVLPDAVLKGALKWLLSGIRAVCYFFITYSFYGYIVKYGVVTNLAGFDSADVCSLVGMGYTHLVSLDDYVPLGAEICAQMQGQVVQQIVGTKILGTPDQMGLAKSLALTDVINAATWLIIVVVLEVEVWLQLKNRLSDRLLKASVFVKTILYLILLACAIYWGIDGDFLDFWDAFLWLVAFVFIELNIFQWHDSADAGALGQAGA